MLNSVVEAMAYGLYPIVMRGGGVLEVTNGLGTYVESLRELIAATQLYERDSKVKSLVQMQV